MSVFFRGNLKNVVQCFTLGALAFASTPVCTYAQQMATVSSSITDAKTMTDYYNKYMGGNIQEKIVLVKALSKSFGQAISVGAIKDSTQKNSPVLKNNNRTVAKQMLQSALNDQSQELNVTALGAIGENNFGELTTDVLGVYNKTSNPAEKRIAALNTLAALGSPQLLPLINSVLQSQSIDQLTSAALRIIDNNNLCTTMAGVKSVAQRAKDQNAQFIKDNKEPPMDLMEISDNAESVFVHLATNGPCN